MPTSWNNNTERKNMEMNRKIGSIVCPPPYNSELKPTHKLEHTHTHKHTRLKVIVMGTDMFEMERGQLCHVQIFRGWQVTGIRSPKHPGGCARRWSPGSCQRPQTAPSHTN